MGTDGRQYTATVYKKIREAPRIFVHEFKKSIPELFYSKSKASFVEEKKRVPSVYRIIAVISKILRHTSIINVILQC